MKRLSILLLISLLANGSIFTDVDEDAWYYSSLEELYEADIISGYSDQSFQPDQTISVEEFIVMVIKSMNIAIETDDLDWSKAYINRAMIDGLVIEREFDDYTKPITRGQMARLLLRSLDPIDEEYVNRASQIKDINDYTIYWQNIGLRIYTSGLMMGYPDGSIYLHHHASRAEACVIIKKYIDSMGK